MERYSHAHLESISSKMSCLFRTTKDCIETICTLQQAKICNLNSRPEETWHQYKTPRSRRSPSSRRRSRPKTCKASNYITLRKRLQTSLRRSACHQWSNRWLESVQGQLLKPLIQVAGVEEIKRWCQIRVYMILKTTRQRIYSTWSKRPKQKIHLY